jgi:exopolysaccharide production protein ExoQ
MRTTADGFLPHPGPFPYGSQDLVHPRAPMRTTTAVPAWEAAFVVGSCFVFGTSILQIIAGGAEAGSSGEIANTPAWVQLSYLAIYGVALALMTLRVGATQVALGAAPLLVFLALYPFISIGWSASSAETLRRGVALFGTMIFGFYLGSRFTITTLVGMLSLTFALIGLTSLATVILLPGIGTHQTAEWLGAWKGLFSHKNGLGGGAALGAIVVLYGVFLSRGILRLVLIASLLVLMLLLARAMSTTGVVTFAVLLLLLVWCRVAQVAPWIGAVAATTGLLLVVLALLPYMSGGGLGELWAQLGKSGDISGRTPLWALAWDSVARSPWFGYGYEAFWIAGTSEMKRIQQLLHFTPFYSHNGILETLLNGGIILLCLVALAFLSLSVRGGIMLFAERSIFAASFPLVFAVYFALSNITESKILTRNDLVWIIFCALSVVVGKRVRIRLRTGRYLP